MGEYAEMMLDGTCCHTCGEYLGTDNGYPTACESCGDDCEEEGSEAVTFNIASFVCNCVEIIELGFEGRSESNARQLLSRYIAGQLKNSTVVDGFIKSPALEKQLKSAKNQPNNKKFKVKRAMK